MRRRSPSRRVADMSRLRPKTVVRPDTDAAGRPKARVSVVIPTYNYGHFLPSSVGSVLAQDGVEPEVVIVNDCSTDDTASVVEELARTDGRVVFVDNEVNHGPCVAFND